MVCVERVECRASLQNGRLDLAPPLVHGVDVGAQGCRLAFEFLQAMELFKAGVHTATVSPTNAECRTPNAEGERGRGTWILGLMKLKGLPRGSLRRRRATMDACRT